MFAVIGKSTKTLKILLDQLSDVESCNIELLSLVLKAAEIGSKEVMKILIDNGGKVDVFVKFGSTPLCLSVARCDPECVDFIIKEGGAKCNFKGRNLLSLLLAQVDFVNVETEQMAELAS